MAADDRFRIPFNGGTNRSGPLTYGQQYILNSIVQTDPRGQSNPIVSVRVPDGTDMRRVCAAVSEVVLAHEALRTKVESAGAGPGHRQRVHGDGSVECLVFRDCRADKPPAFVETTTAQPGFDVFEDWPLRIGVVVRSGQPVRIVAVVSHFAADLAGADVVRRDLLARLGSPEKVNTSCRQPLDQAAYEQSTHGGRRTAAALAYWEQQLARFPDFTLPEREGSEPRFWQGTLVSPELRTVIPKLVSASGSSVAAVALAAVARATADLSGTNTCSTTVMCSNRHLRELKDSVMNLAQRVPVTIDLGSVSLTDVARGTSAALLRSYKYGQYPPSAVRELIRACGEAHGRPLDTYWGVNPVTSTNHFWNDNTSGSRSFSWTRKTGADMDRLRFIDFYAPDRICLYADTRCVAPEETRSFLERVEGVLVSGVHKG